MSLIDHKVPYRTEAFIADVAAKYRQIGTVPGSNRVNLQTILDELQAHGVESIARIPGVKRKGRLTIEVVDDDSREFPAYVKFRPCLTMVVQKTVWRHFQEGHSKEQVIVGHEIGHIALHDDEAKQFSRDERLQINFAENEYSAEWQANRLVDHLLIPTPLVRQLKDAWRIAFLCNVPEDFASERISATLSIKKMLNSSLSGEPCPKCGDFALVTKAGGESCDACGYVGVRARTTPATDADWENLLF